MSVRIPVSLIAEPEAHRPPSNFVPKLAWPSLDSSNAPADLGRFPRWDEERRRHAAGEFGAWSDEFMVALERARKRVWLIDGFLLKVDERAKATFFQVFERALASTRAEDIRLIIGPKAGHHEQIASLRELEAARRQPPRRDSFAIEIQTVREGKSPVRLPHDRFAVIDAELWHWGANVGGTHHEVNAYSRGWSSRETGAEEYFLRLWKYLKDASV